MNNHVVFRFTVLGNPKSSFRSVHGLNFQGCMLPQICVVLGSWDVQGIFIYESRFRCLETASRDHVSCELLRFVELAKVA